MSKEHENRATFTGNLGWEPEIRDARGTPVLNLRLASNRRMKRGEEWVEETVWVNVPIFGRRAEGLARILHKGDMVLVSGPVALREFETREKGKRTDLECYADKVVLCGGKRSDSGHRDAPAASDNSRPYENDESDIPF